MKEVNTLEDENTFTFNRIYVTLLLLNINVSFLNELALVSHQRML